MGTRHGTCFDNSAIILITVIQGSPANINLSHKYLYDEVHIQLFLDADVTNALLVTVLTFLSPHHGISMSGRSGQARIRTVPVIGLSNGCRHLVSGLRLHRSQVSSWIATSWSHSRQHRPISDLPRWYKLPYHAECEVPSAFTGASRF